jgi:hypothetical protein
VVVDAWFHLLTHVFASDLVIRKKHAGFLGVHKYVAALDQLQLVVFIQAEVHEHLLPL